MQEFIKKVVYIQNTLKAPKNQRNTFGNYNYRSCEDIMEAVKPLLAAQGLVLTVCDDIVQVGDRYYIKSTATITDGQNNLSNSAFAREEETKRGMDASQLTGATSSYARKYALNGLLCIDDTKDADATNTHGKTELKQPKVEKKEMSKGEKDEFVKNKVDEAVRYIDAQDKIIVDSDEHKRFVVLAQKFDAMGYKSEASRLIESLEAKEFKDELPRFE